MKFQTPYDMWEAPHTDQTGEETMTVGSMADEVDINQIMKRFGLTGLMPENPVVPNWGADYSEAPTDYRTALERINHAQESFMQIPAEIRAKFQNDPGTWMNWIHDPKNLDEARKLGFAKALQPAITPPPATPVAAPPPKTPGGA